MGRVVEVIWVKSEPEYFCGRAWTRMGKSPGRAGQIAPNPLGSRLDISIFVEISIDAIVSFR
jgi:hypothetical protein